MNSVKLPTAVADFYRAIQALDAEAWVRSFAVDAICEDPVGSPEARGHEALHGFVTGLFGLFVTFGLTPDEAFASGSGVAVHWTGRGLGRNGARVEFSGIDVFTLDAIGKIKMLQAYWDAGPVLRALSRPR
jgi:steroid Delta-isomerase